MEKPRWYNDNWVCDHPDENKIPCKDCFLREKDRDLGDGNKLKGCTLGICQAFPKGKPSFVLWKGESCPYYIDENESEDEE